MLGKLELVGKACPVFQHSRFVGRHDNSEFRIQADLSQRGGVQFVKDVKGLAASPPIVHKDLPCGFFRTRHGADGVPGVVDPLTLSGVKAANKPCISVCRIIQAPLHRHWNSPQLQHVDHVKVDHIEDFHGPIVPNRAEESPFGTDGDALDHTCTNTASR